MKRYIILNEGYPPFSTHYYDPESHEPENGEHQTVIDLVKGLYRQNWGESAGKWLFIEFDIL